MSLYIALTLICSFFHAVGAVLCKFGLDNLKRVPTENLKEILLFLIGNKYWLLGITVTLLTNYFVLELQSILDVSVIHSIMNSSFLFTLLLGYLVLKEILSTPQWIGTLTVIIGAATIMSVDNHITGQSTNMNALQIQGAISFSIIGVLISLPILYRNVNYEVLYAIAAGVAFGNSQIFVKVTTNYITDQTGSFSVFSVQSLTELINVWPTLLVVIFAISGFICMQISFTHGKVSICVALLAVISRAISTSSGYYIFGEEFPFSKVIGIATILIGVSIITLSTVIKEDYELAPAQQ